MKLLVLGSGCDKCNKLAELTSQAAQELGLEYEMDKISDLKQILAFRVMTTPALVVDGAVRVTSKVPKLDELKSILQQTAK